MTTPKIEAVIFDMDELLIDSGRTWFQVETEVFSTVGVYLDETMCLETVGLRIDGIVDHWYRRFPWSDKSVDEVASAIRDGIAQRTIAHTYAMPGAVELVEALSRQNVPLAICSSSPQSVIEAALRNLNVFETFSLVYSAEKEPYGKPHPGCYLSVAERFGVDPVHCLVFEDSFVGALAAKAARMTVIAVPAPADRCDPRFGFCDEILEGLASFDVSLTLKYLLDGVQERTMSDG